MNLKTIAETLGARVTELIEPLVGRIRALETRVPEKGEKGERGEPGTKGDRGETGPSGASGADGAPGAAGDRGEKGEAGASGRDGIDGKDGKDGIDGKDGAYGAKGDKGDPGEKGETGEKGDKGDPGEKGEVGDKGDLGEKGEKGEKGDKGDPGEKGEVGAAGQNGKSLTIEDVRDFLDATMSKWMLDAERMFREKVEKYIAELPKPRDGVDGLSVDDIDLDVDRRTLLFGHEGKVIKEIPIPYPKHEGVWKPEGVSNGGYDMGMMVTFGGNIWLTPTGSETKPGTDKSWILVVKKGRDGRDKI